MSKAIKAGEEAYFIITHNEDGCQLEVCDADGVNKFFNGEDDEDESGFDLDAVVTSLPEAMYSLSFDEGEVRVKNRSADCIALIIKGKIVTAKPVEVVKRVEVD